MATTSTSHRSGGKIVANRRRNRLAATPYDRPPPPRSERQLPKSPNWFSGVILPSARAIASGAGKILSSVFFSDDDDSSEDNSVSEDDADNDYIYEPSADGVNNLHKENEKTLFLESQSNASKTNTKRLIEQLVMQEIFSREECDRLVTILKSRVLDFPTREAGENLCTEPLTKTGGDENISKFDEAVMEAKKWLEEKKVGSSLDLELDRRASGFNSAVLQHSESEGGSPVDMAKSYMKARPLWASPRNQIELRTPSSMVRELYKEGASNLAGYESLSSSKKRYSLTSGSWNIQEELRRVRAKASEDMLRTPSSKLDRSVFEITQEGGTENLGSKELVATIEEKTNELESLTKTKPTNVSSDLDTGVTLNSGLAAIDSKQDGITDEELLPGSATLISEKHEVSEATQIDGECAGSVPPGPASLSPALDHQNGTNSSRLSGSMGNEVDKLDGKQGTNGVVLSQESLSARAGMGQNLAQAEEEERNAESINRKESTTTNRMEDKCELLSETYVEVPVVTETSSVATGSHNSFSVQYEELSQELTQPESLTELTGNVDVVAVKQQGRKSGRNTRRSRGRGK